jgi:hypothetical protein
MTAALKTRPSAIAIPNCVQTRSVVAQDKFIVGLEIE